MINRIFSILHRRERTRLIWLAVAVVLMGLLEVAGVASILPFMQLAADTNALEQNEWLAALYDWGGFENHRQMLIALGVGVMVLISFTSAFSLLVTWLQFRFSWYAAHQFSTRLLRLYLNKPYQFYLDKNTTELQTYIVSEINSLAAGVILPVIEIFSRTFVALVIFGLLLWVDPKIAIVMTLALGGAYILIYLAQRNYLKRIGEHRIAMNMLRYRHLSEMLEGIKTVFATNKQAFFYHRFEAASKEFCEVQPKYNVLLAAPRYLLEFLAFGSILTITLYLFIQRGDLQSAIPSLSLYAVAGYRLLPALQKTFSAAGKLRHNLPILDQLYPELLRSLSVALPVLPKAGRQQSLQDSIQLHQLTFSYPNAEERILDDFNLSIPQGATVAFVGSTGSGKTTLVDLIVGLLQPDAGEVRIDGKQLSRDNLMQWRDRLGYVPQDVFLIDDSIACNIALGESELAIEQDKLLRAARLANIDTFIANTLPDGFATKIGERGVRLSGGQRQRIGLARALYHDPDVLILDEATSALDSVTEHEIIQSIKSLPQRITKIIIAHRLSTVRQADFIYLLQDGRIMDQGSFDELVASNASFKTMVDLS